MWNYKLFDLEQFEAAVEVAKAEQAFMVRRQDNLLAVTTLVSFRDRFVDEGGIEVPLPCDDES